MTRQCLVVRGGWPGHDPVGATDLFRPVLKALGFVVDVEDTPEIYADASALERYDLIVQSVTMGSATVDEVSGLRNAIAAGTGFAGWHGGIVDSFRNSPDYLQLTGAQFAAHPHRPEERGSLDVEPYRDYTVTLTDAGRAHPITQGFDGIDLTTEQYWLLSDPLNEVLATCELVPGEGDEWPRPVTMPVVWTRMWGEGRIFATSLGHTVEVLERPDVNAMIARGMDWAAR